jgi:hypothetical protein
MYGVKASDISMLKTAAERCHIICIHRKAQPHHCMGYEHTVQDNSVFVTVIKCCYGDKDASKTVTP